ncbi:MAG: hypothetical protein ACRBDI_09500 [Alphaproteobacteria bacterium]
MNATPKRHQRNDGTRTFWFVCVAAVISFSFYMFAPDYKKSDWILKTDWPVQKIGQSDASYFGDQFLFVAEFPFKAVRTVIMLQAFKLSYNLSKDVPRYQSPEIFGGFFLLLSPSQKPEGMIRHVQDIKSYFDSDGDGDGDGVTWVNKNGAVLFYDKNKNGRVDDAYELLRPSNRTQWSVFQELDKNKDGVFDMRDPDFRWMMLWWDDNDNHKQEDGEYLYAEDFLKEIRFSTVYDYSGDHVDSIQSTPKKSALTREAVLVSYVRLVTKEDNKVLPLFFKLFGEQLANNRATLYGHLISKNIRDRDILDVLQSYEALPNLRGYGDTPDLHVKIYEDKVVRQDLSALLVMPADELLSDIMNYNQVVERMLFHWADVQDVDPDSRGWFIDARILHYIEKLRDDDFYQLNHYYYPMPYGAQHLKTRLWPMVFNRHRAALLMQLPAGHKILNGSHKYRYLSETYETTGLSSEYLMYLANLVKNNAVEEKRELLSVVSDVANIIIEDQNLPESVRRNKRLVDMYKKKQVDIVMAFRDKLFE